jgi:hypothetical protein
MGDREPARIIHARGGKLVNIVPRGSSPAARMRRRGCPGARPTVLSAVPAASRPSSYLAVRASSLPSFCVSLSVEPFTP